MVTVLKNYPFHVVVLLQVHALRFILKRCAEEENILFLEILANVEYNVFSGIYKVFTQLVYSLANLSVRIGLQYVQLLFCNFILLLPNQMLLCFQRVPVAVKNIYTCVILFFVNISTSFANPSTTALTGTFGWI